MSEYPGSIISHDAVISEAEVLVSFNTDIPCFMTLAIAYRPPQNSPRFLSRRGVIRPHSQHYTLRVDAWARQEELNATTRHTFQFPWRSLFDTIWYLPVVRNTNPGPRAYGAIYAVQCSNFKRFNLRGDFIPAGTFYDPVFDTPPGPPQPFGPELITKIQSPPPAGSFVSASYFVNQTLFSRTTSVENLVFGFFDSGFDAPPATSVAWYTNLLIGDDITPGFSSINIIHRAGSATCDLIISGSVTTLELDSLNDQIQTLHRLWLTGPFICEPPYAFPYGAHIQQINLNGGYALPIPPAGLYEAHVEPLVIANAEGPLLDVSASWRNLIFDTSLTT